MVLSEFWGTLALIWVGCSFVVLDFSVMSPVIHWIPAAALRRALTGFLFGTTGGLIAVSPVGKTSGAHINPVITLAFWMQKKLSGRLALSYIGAQVLGAIAGAWLLSKVFGRWAFSVHDAATLPGPSGDFLAVVGEGMASICLVIGLFLFLRSRTWRKYTPMLFAPLYAVMVWLEAPWSGTSTNPARSFGPELISHAWHGWWVYWIGPLGGGVVGFALLLLLFPWLYQEVEIAKLFHFHHDPDGVFRSQRWHQLSEDTGSRDFGEKR